MKQANKELFAEVVKYINSGLGGKIYTFTAFFTNTPGLDNSVLRRGSSTFFKCPFHDDKTPSFGFNDKTLEYHCFSCGSGGTYLNFVHEYNVKVLGRNISIYQLVEEMLKADSVMQAKLGFNSIMASTDRIIDLKNFKRFKACNLSSTNFPHNYLELSTLGIKKCISDQQKILMISLMQSGFDVKTIYKEIFGENLQETHENKVFDIAAALEDDDEVL